MYYTSRDQNEGQPAVMTVRPEGVVEIQFCHPPETHCCRYTKILNYCYHYIIILRCVYTLRASNIHK